MEPAGVSDSGSTAARIAAARQDASAVASLVEEYRNYLRFLRALQALRPHLEKYR